jgi:hypothetical protein
LASDVAWYVQVYIIKQGQHKPSTERGKAMARRHHSYKAYEAKSLDTKEERERVFAGRISKIIEALAITVNEIDGVPSLPPALGKLVKCAAEASDSLHRCEDEYLRSR